MNKEVLENVSWVLRYRANHFVHGKFKQYFMVFDRNDHTIIMIQHESTNLILE